MRRFFLELGQNMTLLTPYYLLKDLLFESLFDYLY